MDFKTSLRVQRDSLIEERQALCLPAQGFNRDLSAGEQDRYDKVSADADSINARLKQLDEHDRPHS